MIHQLNILTWIALINMVHEKIIQIYLHIQTLW